MIRLNISLILTLILLSGCNSDNCVSNKILDLEAVLEYSSIESLSNLGYDTKVILLETTDNALLPKNSHIVHTSDSDIVICGDRMLYRFGTDGKFKNTVEVLVRVHMSMQLLQVRILIPLMGIL